VSIGKLCEVHARTHPGTLFRAPREPEAPAAPAAPPRASWFEPVRRLFSRLRRGLAGTSES